MNQLNSGLFAKNLQHYMSMHDETQADIARLLGVSKSAVTLWMQGRTQPRMDKIDKLVQHWAIRRSDLLEAATSKNEPTDLLDKEIYRLFSQLSPEQKQQAVSKLQELIDNQ